MSKINEEQIEVLEYALEMMLEYVCPKIKAAVHEHVNITERTERLLNYHRAMRTVEECMPDEVSERECCYACPCREGEDY
jgi:hypothetical protein